MLKELVAAIMHSKPYRWVIRQVMPFARFSLGYSDLRGWQYQRGYELLKPGHILVSVDRHKLNSVLIPGTFSHAALCVDKGSEWEVSEMTHKHHTKSAFYDICSQADRVAILECKDWDPEYVEKIIAKCKSFEHIKYDVEFEPGLKNLYCSELVYEADFERRLKLAPFKGNKDLGLEIIPPDSLLNADNVEVVWDSDAEMRLEMMQLGGAMLR